MAWLKKSRRQWLLSHIANHNWPQEQIQNLHFFSQWSPQSNWSKVTRTLVLTSHGSTTSCAGPLQFGPLTLDLTLPDKDNTTRCLENVTVVPFIVTFLVMHVFVRAFQRTNLPWNRKSEIDPNPDPNPNIAAFFAFADLQTSAHLLICWFADFFAFADLWICRLLRICWFADQTRWVELSMMSTTCCNVNTMQQTCRQWHCRCTMDKAQKQNIVSTNREIDRPRSCSFCFTLIFQCTCSFAIGCLHCCCTLSSMTPCMAFTIILGQPWLLLLWHGCLAKLWCNLEMLLLAWRTRAFRFLSLVLSMQPKWRKGHLKAVFGFESFERERMHVRYDCDLWDNNMNVEKRRRARTCFVRRCACVSSSLLWKTFVSTKRKIDHACAGVGDNLPFHESKQCHNAFTWDENFAMWHGLNWIKCVSIVWFLNSCLVISLSVGTWASVCLTRHESGVCGAKFRDGSST